MAVGCEDELAAPVGGEPRGVAAVPDELKVRVGGLARDDERRHAARGGLGRDEDVAYLVVAVPDAVEDGAEAADACDGEDDDGGVGVGARVDVLDDLAGAAGLGEDVGGEPLGGVASRLICTRVSRLTRTEVTSVSAIGELPIGEHSMLGYTFPSVLVQWCESKDRHPMVY